MPKKIKKNTKKKDKKSEAQQHLQPVPLQSIAQRFEKTEKTQKSTQKPAEAQAKPKSKKLSLAKKALIIIPMAAILLTMALLKAQDRYRLVMQTDYSVNFRLAYMDARDRIPSKGQYTAFIFKAVIDHPRYGKQFVKRVACVPGEDLQTRGRDFYCDNVYIGTAKTHDRTGKPAPLFVYSGKIPEGLFFASGETKDSYDSKYWGLVPNEWVTGKVKKII